MNRVIVRNLGLAGALVLTLSKVSSAQVPSGSPYEFLRAQIGYTDDELRVIANGGAMVKLLETPEAREVAVSGVVHLRASTSFFLRMFQDIERFDTAALAIKKMSDPPQDSDFDGMDIPDDDLKALPDCGLGDCGMKLGEAALQRVQNEVDWNDSDAPQQAESILKEQALLYIRAYLEGGSRALGVYYDKKKPQLIESDFEALLQNAPYILAYRPELHRYLTEFPKAKLEGAADFFYWAQYDYGKRVIRLNHVTIYPTQAGDNGSAIVTIKHLWYTHYFTTGLDLYALVRDEQSEEDAFYLVTLVRMRTDGVGSGMFGKMLKKTLAGNILNNIQAYLTSMKGAVERYYQDDLARRR